MQDHPTGGPARPDAQRDPGERALQRDILVGLLTDPSDAGEDIATIAASVGRPQNEVADAIEPLIWIGLLRRRGSLVGASGAAMCFDELWPLPR
jgi:hypothetical protein